MTSRRALDPDELARLTEERSFLLQSMSDLDAELAAGDIDPRDHTALQDDYTRRAAEVIRSIEDHERAFDERPSPFALRRVLITLGVVALVATVAGVLLARSSGFRSPSDSLTGGIRRSVPGLLAEADTLTREGRYEEAIDVYTEALEAEPSNVEALSYRGWLLTRIDETESGLADLAAAVDLDGAAPDPRVFRAIMFADQERWPEARDELAVLDTLDVPDEISGLVSSSDLVFRVNSAIASEALVAPEPFSLDLLAGSLDDAARVAAEFDAAGDALSAARVFNAILAEDPDHVPSLVIHGRTLGVTPEIITAEPDIAARGLAYLDRAVELVPDDPEVLLWRALARVRQGDPEGAAQDAEAIDEQSLPETLSDWFDTLTLEIAESR